MSHLLAISIGPVQEFIAAARRTRDLWYGSNLLSKISKSAARAVQAFGGELIFPAPEGPGDLEHASTLQVANVILARLPDADPREAARQAKEAAATCWRSKADKVGGKFNEYIDQDIWKDQVDDVIEFYAAWVPLESEAGGYRLARRKVMRLLAGRKNGRDFLPSRGAHRVPKSSLDGRRDSVLKRPEQWPAAEPLGLRLQAGEQLDVVGLVKRAASGNRPYPSVARVAADPWIRGLVAAERHAELEHLRDACKQMEWAGIHRISVRDYPQYADFPFEGTVVYPSRHRDIEKEIESKETLQPLAAPLNELIEVAGEPSPYLTVLVADGDRVGKALSTIEDSRDHQGFSRGLAAFAGRVRNIVQSQHGFLVYAGGDDVLAFVPVDTCLECARKLRNEYVEIMRPWSKKPGEGLTLSVGLAIAHFMENLEDLLNFGLAAEKHAKTPKGEGHNQEERDGLAVHLHKRGGGPIEVRANWDDSLDGRLAVLATSLNDRTVSGRVAYDLRRVAEVYKNWDNAGDVETAIQRDALRVIQAKQPREGDGAARLRGLLGDRVRDAGSLRRLADEILVSRQVAVAIRQARGPKPDEEVRS